MKYNRRLFRYSSKRARRNTSPLTGFLDHYNGVVLKEGDRYDMEHIFPLSLAFKCGFRDLIKNKGLEFAKYRMRQFANDSDNLIPVLASSNRSRGASSLWDYAPLNLAWIPERNRRVRLLADRYGLKLTRRMKWSMDFADRKILKHRNGIRLGKVRAWLINNGFYRFLMPF